MSVSPHHEIEQSIVFFRILWARLIKGDVPQAFQGVVIGNPLIHQIETIIVFIDLIQGGRR